MVRKHRLGIIQYNIPYHMFVNISLFTFVKYNMLANIVYIGENIAQSTNNITLKPNLKSRVTMIAVSSIERHIIIMSIQHTAIQLSKKNLIILTKLSKKDFIVFILVFFCALYIKTANLLIYTTGK